MAVEFGVALDSGFFGEAGVGEVEIGAGEVLEDHDELVLLAEFEEDDQECDENRGLVDGFVDVKSPDDPDKNQVKIWLEQLDQDFCVVNIGEGVC